MSKKIIDTYNAARIHQPETVEQVREVVRHSRKVRALGARRPPLIQRYRRFARRHHLAGQDTEIASLRLRSGQASFLLAMTNADVVFLPILTWPRPLRFQARTKLKLTMKSMENMKKKLHAFHVLHG
ncbi:MAG TPA: hypothetical protein VGD99_21340 [Anaerolineae bacterium]